jgi:hypothetical protein
MPAFARPIGIDYSGAETRTARLKGLRVYLAEGDAPPAEIVPPPPSPMKYWTRRGIAEWLVELGALPPGAETARCASHVLPNCDFREAIRVNIYANILI